MSEKVAVTGRMTNVLHERLNEHMLNIFCDDAARAVEKIRAHEGVTNAYLGVSDSGLPILVIVDHRYNIAAVEVSLVKLLA